LPLGNLDAGSPAYTDVYTVNADKTVTVIAEGWYSISAMLSCSTPPLTDAPNQRHARESEPSIRTRDSTLSCFEQLASSCYSRNDLHAGQRPRWSVGE
jgi:hypothetical protein